VIGASKLYRALHIVSAHAHEYTGGTPLNREPLANALDIMTAFASEHGIATDDDPPSHTRPVECMRIAASHIARAGLIAMRKRSDAFDLSSDVRLAIAFLRGAL